MDVKVMNVFVDQYAVCHLGDCGSCKPIGVPVTSCSITFCYEDTRGLIANPKYDYFMFLVMILIECMENRRDCISSLSEEHSPFPSIMQSVIEIKSSPPALVKLLQEALAQLNDFKVVSL